MYMYVTWALPPRWVEDRQQGMRSFDHTASTRSRATTPFLAAAHHTLIFPISRVYDCCFHVSQNPQSHLTGSIVGQHTIKHAQTRSSRNSCSRWGQNVRPTRLRHFFLPRSTAAACRNKRTVNQASTDYGKMCYTWTMIIVSELNQASIGASKSNCQVSQLLPARVRSLDFVLNRCSESEMAHVHR